MSLNLSSLLEPLQDLSQFIPAKEVEEPGKSVAERRADAILQLLAAAPASQKAAINNLLKMKPSTKQKKKLDAGKIRAALLEELDEDELDGTASDDEDANLDDEMPDNLPDEVRRKKAVLSSAPLEWDGRPVQMIYEKEEVRNLVKSKIRDQYSTDTSCRIIERLDALFNADIRATTQAEVDDHKLRQKEVTDALLLLAKEAGTSYIGVIYPTQSFTAQTSHSSNWVPQEYLASINGWSEETESEVLEGGCVVESKATYNQDPSWTTDINAYRGLTGLDGKGFESFDWEPIASPKSSSNTDVLQASAPGYETAYRAYVGKTVLASIDAGGGVQLMSSARLTQRFRDMMEDPHDDLVIRELLLELPLLLSHPDVMVKVELLLYYRKNNPDHFSVIVCDQAPVAQAARIPQPARHSIAAAGIVFRALACDKALSPLTSAQAHAPLQVKPLLWANGPKKSPLSLLPRPEGVAVVRRGYNYNTLSKDKRQLATDRVRVFHRMLEYSAEYANLAVAHSDADEAEIATWGGEAASLAVEYFKSTAWRFMRSRPVFSTFSDIQLILQVSQTKKRRKGAIKRLRELVKIFGEKTTNLKSYVDEMDSMLLLYHRYIIYWPVKLQSKARLLGALAKELDYQTNESRRRYNVSVQKWAGHLVLCYDCWRYFTETPSARQSHRKNCSQKAKVDKARFMKLGKFEKKTRPDGYRWKWVRESDGKPIKDVIKEKRFEADVVSQLEASSSSGGNTDRKNGREYEAKSRAKNKSRRRICAGCFKHYSWAGAGGHHRAGHPLKCDKLDEVLEMEHRWFDSGECKREDRVFTRLQDNQDLQDYIDSIRESGEGVPCPSRKSKS